MRELVDAGVRVGLGVDGSASNERGDLCFELKQALLCARVRGGPGAMSAREALRLATRGGAARPAARRHRARSSPGKRADLAVWRADGLELGGAADLRRRARPRGAGTGSSACSWAAARSSATGACVRGSEQEIAREHRIQTARLWR